MTTAAGDDRVRHCALCDRSVYDLAQLTSAETVALLESRESLPCVRLHRRRDGTVITSDCARGRRDHARDREADIRRATEQVNALRMDTTTGMGRIATQPSDPDDR